MIEIGQYHELEVIKEVDFGLYLAAGEEELLLPLKYIPSGTQVGDILRVFVYNDGETRPIATTLEPYATVGEFAFLRVLESSGVGAFLDWGIAKDIFVPFKEQAQPMRDGRKYVVYVYLDDMTNRVVASSKWNKFISQEPLNEKIGDAVDILIAEQTDLGFKAIIHNTHLGLLYTNEIFEPLSIGDSKKGYIKNIREDGKIDLRLQPSGYEHIDNTKEKILQELKANNGILSLGDKSSPEEIYEKLGLSKKAYKKTIGGLFKDRLIEISDTEIRLISTKK
jgi:predicted RNA-binding protein (virulence factor B family)